MALFRIMLALVLAFSFSIKSNGQTNDTGVQTVSMKIDSIRYPYAFWEREKGKTLYEKLYKHWVNSVQFEYGYYKNGQRTGMAVWVDFNPKGYPQEMRISVRSDYKGGLSAYLSFEDMMSGIRYVLDDIRKKNDLHQLYRVIIRPLGFGEASVAVYRQYAKELGNKKYDGELLGRLYEESEIIACLGQLLSLYGKQIRHVDFEHVISYNRDAYVAFYKYPGDKDTLPINMPKPESLEVYLRNSSDMQ